MVPATGWFAHIRLWLVEVDGGLEHSDFTGNVWAVPQPRLEVVALQDTINLLSEPVNRNKVMCVLASEKTQVIQ